jgi:hypothetical protein
VQTINFMRSRSEFIMKREFIVERQGKPFVMYAGLLNLAHENGLRSIRTDLIQAPTQENGHVAICGATVVLEKAGTEYIYTGIGDAAVNNVGQAMRSSLIRMAETRAKARALRDAVNVGVSAFEELNETDGSDIGPRAVRNRGARQERPISAESDEEGRSAHPRYGSKSPGAGSSDSNSSDPKPITPAQSNAIASMCRPRSLDADQLAKEQFAAESLAALTTAQAAELIRMLSSAARARTSAAA